MTAFDLRGITDPGHKQIIKSALNACDYKFNRVRKNSGVRVPVTVTDTSRQAAEAQLVAGADHHGPGFSALTEPTNRAVALGLFWLPTAQYPAGRIEVGLEAIANPPLAQEVFLAEAAHSIDYTVLTDQDRAAIFTIVHGGDSISHGTHGWFEERGGERYWNDWVGENFMALFMRAFAPALARPLEARQPWEHRATDEMAAQVRRLLR